jgi:hypothetical protein
VNVLRDAVIRGPLALKENGALRPPAASPALAAALPE